MKQALQLIAAMAVAAALTYLLVANRQLHDQLDRANQALAQQQENRTRLESELEAAQDRLRTSASPTSNRARPDSRPTRSNALADPATGPAAAPGTLRDAVSAAPPGGLSTLPVPVPVAPPSSWARYESQPGSQVQVTGTSSVKDWELNGNIIGGQLWLPAGFDSNPRAVVNAAASNLACQANVLIPVRTLKSQARVMDDTVAASLEAPQFPRIEFQLRGLRFDATSTAAFTTNGGRTLLFMSAGDLLIHGVTNAIEMPVLFELGPPGQVRISGFTQLKLTDFGIQPPAPTYAQGVIRVADEIKVLFHWQLKRTGTRAADQ